VSRSIVLQARLAFPAEADKMIQRLAATTAEYPQLGRPPESEPVTEATIGAVRDAFASRPCQPGDPLLRVAIGETDRLVLLAANDAAVNELGLLALLGRALDVPVATSVTGLGDVAAPTSFARRLYDAVLRPSARIAPAGGTGDDDGDALVALRAGPLPLGTATLTAAIGRTVASWNAAPGRIVAGIGASRRDGSRPEPEAASACLLVPLGADPDADRIDAALAQPRVAPDLPATALGRLARPLADRLAPTFLVSTMGSVSAGGIVTELAVFPAAVGSAGVAFGAATVAGMTTITIRARRAHFDHLAAAGFLTDLMRQW